MYASTASMTQNNGIHVTLEQTLAPSGSTSGSTSSTGTASSNGDNQKVNTISQNVFLNNMRNNGPVSLPGSVRATPTLELYPRHLRTHSYTQAIPNTRNTNTNFVYNPVTAPVHRRYHNQDFALRNLRSDSQEFALRNMRSDSVNSILQDKIHGRQSSSSAGYYFGVYGEGYYTWKLGYSWYLKHVHYSNDWHVLSSYAFINMYFIPAFPKSMYFIPMIGMYFILCTLFLCEHVLYYWRPLKTALKGWLSQLKIVKERKGTERPEAWFWNEERNAVPGFKKERLPERERLFFSERVILWEWGMYVIRIHLLKSFGFLKSFRPK